LFIRELGTNKLVQLDKGIYKPYCITQPLIPSFLASRSSLKEEAQIHHWNMHQINGLEKDKIMVALMNKRMHDISNKLANAFYNLVFCEVL
jgi:hypothetical protein